MNPFSLGLVVCHSYKNLPFLWLGVVWHLVHKVIKLLGVSVPPLSWNTMWCICNICSLPEFLQLGFWHLWPSLCNIYSLIFQNPCCSPCWYSAPCISGFLIFCISKLATSTIILVIGKILFSLSINLIWLSSLCWMLGVNLWLIPLSNLTSPDINSFFSVIALNPMLRMPFLLCLIRRLP